MMKKEEDKRRSFLKHILAGTAVVMGTAATIGPAKGKSAATINLLDETLYHESESFKKYYKNLRS
jgi:glycerate kinase